MMKKLTKRRIKKFDEDVAAKRDITKEIVLNILKTGALLTVAFIAPNALKVFYESSRNNQWKNYYPSSIARTTERLYRKGLVKIRKIKSNTIVEITRKGKLEVLKYDLENLQVMKPDHWDGKWRLVIFDIAEKYRKSRDLVREKLKQIGFYQFQKSVFIYPYPCEKEIKYLREVLHVPHEIKLLRADRVENDEDLRKIFKLT